MSAYNGLTDEEDRAMKWCGHCQDHHLGDHYDADGYHKIGVSYGPAGMPPLDDLGTVTRLEVIDHRPSTAIGDVKAFSVWGVTVRAEMQDDGRTLKLWVT